MNVYAVRPNGAPGSAEKREGASTVPFPVASIASRRNLVLAHTGQSAAQRSVDEHTRLTSYSVIRGLLRSLGNVLKPFAYLLMQIREIVCLRVQRPNKLLFGYPEWTLAILQLAIWKELFHATDVLYSPRD